jgi:hypothetical protein
MPWTEPLANSNELRRCIRDLVALSAGWQNYDMRQIGGSIVAALISILDADFVFIALPGDGNQLISELARNRLTPKSLKHVRTMLQRNSALLGSGQEFVFGDASGGGLHVATAPIGFGGDATLAAGCFRDTFPTRTEKLLLNTGANQAAIAFQQWLEDAEKRRFTAIVQRTTDFIGIASLNGQIQYINPAGSSWWDLTPSTTHWGFTCWISFRPRTVPRFSARSGRWCFAPGGGRESSTSGILDLEYRYPSWSIASGSTIRTPGSR